MDIRALLQRIASAARQRPDAPHLSFRIRNDEVESLLKSLRYFLTAPARCAKERQALEDTIRELRKENAALRAGRAQPEPAALDPWQEQVLIRRQQRDLQRQRCQGVA